MSGKDALLNMISFLATIHENWDNLSFTQQKLFRELTLSFGDRTLS